MTGDIYFIILMSINVIFFMLGAFATFMCIKENSDTEWLFSILFFSFSCISCYIIIANTIHYENIENVIYHKDDKIPNEEQVDININGVSYEISIKRVEENQFHIKKITKYNIFNEVKETCYKLSSDYEDKNNEPIPIEL